jgi:molybdopterin-containing oxidoreductase family iron-sulfur binding subunit
MTLKEKGIEGKKFVMVIDLSRLQECWKCRESCNHAHQLHPDHKWIKIYQMQDSEETAPLLATNNLHAL